MMPILILAAGQSSRMGGRDKCLEPVGGEPRLHRLARRSLQVSDQVFIALPRADHPRATALADLPVTILAIPEAAEGMGGSMRGAIPHLPEAPRFMLLLADLAEIDAGDIRKVAEAAVAHPAPITRGATEDGRHGHPVVFDAALRPAFAALTGDSGGEPIVSPLRDQTRLVPLKGNRARRDLDTPEDWELFRKETGL